ncbi:ankyrin-3 [Echria macrotheca]|uniref:Ankyrin-3 n=1 Tax=Echria macrotheca TaxID=438768 RepID=A0AAJ0BAJ4_9PEZI|nr:ankyrin-3 [Echria macrotheca]
MAQSTLYREALESFKTEAIAKYREEKDRGILGEFLTLKATPHDAKKAAESLGEEVGRKYGSRRVGDTEIPQKWIAGILDNIGSFIQIGDYATEGAPESVGLAWYAVRLTLSAIQANYDLYNLFGTGLSDISEVMIIIPHYDKLYDQRGTDGWTPSGVVDRLFQDIKKVYVAVLDFSLTIKRHIKGSVTDKIRHGFKDFFGLQKPKFEGKLTEIARLKKKIIEECQAAFQEKALEGLDSMQDVVGGIRATVAQIQAFQPQLELLHAAQMAKLNDMYNDIKMYTRPRTAWELALQEADIIQATLKPAGDKRAEFLALADCRFSGTLSWFFASEEYCWWKKQACRLLCINGPPGIGKSTLLSVIAKERTELSNPPAGKILLYVSCGQDGCQNGDDAFNSLLCQLHSLAIGSKDTNLVEACNKVLMNKSSNAKDGLSTNAGRGIGFVGAHQRQKPKLEDPALAFKKLSGLLKVEEVLVVVDAVNGLSGGEKITLSRGLVKLLSAFRADAISATRLHILVGSSTPFDISFMSTDTQGRPELKAKKGKSSGEEDARSIDLGSDVWEREHQGDLRLKFLASLRELPGLSDGEKDSVLREVLRRADGRFIYLDMAMEFLRQPLLRPIEDHLKLLPELGDRRKFDAELRKLGPNYVRLLRTALTWSLLGKVWPRAEVVMEDFNQVYKMASSASQQGSGFPPPSPLDMEQLVAVSGPFLSLRDEADGCRVVVHDYDKVRDYCMTEVEQTTPEEKMKDICTTCRSETPRFGTLTISEKIGHLDLAIACLTHINNAVFQSRAGFFDTPTEANSRSSYGIDITGESDEDFGSHSEYSDEGFDNPGGDEREVFHPSRHRYILRRTRSWQDEEGEAADFDYDSMEDEDADEAGVDESVWVDGEADPEPLRYEIQYWPYHVREAEDRSTVEERDACDRWKRLFEELDKLVKNQSIFHKWQKTYRHETSTWSGQFFSLAEPRKPVHVAAYLGLASWARHLIVFRGEVVHELSGGCNALQAAAGGATGRRKILEVLLKCGIDVNAETEVVPPGFHLWLSVDSSWEAVDLLMKKGANPLLKCAPYRWLAIFYFAERGTDIRALRALITGKKAARRTVNDFTSVLNRPLHLLLNRQEVSLDVLEALVTTYKADVNAENCNSERPLQLAARRGNLEALKILCKSDEIRVNDPDYTGGTALHDAAANGHSACVEFLISQGADVNQTDDKGRTALRQAAWFGQAGCVKTLLEAGADPTKPDNREGTPLVYACRGASEQSATLIMDELLRQELPLSEINKPTICQRTPLRQAASYGFDNIVRKLTDAAQTQEDESGLAINLQDTYKKISVLNRPDVYKQMSALHRAAWHGHLESVRLLLKAGSDVTIKDVNGKKAMDLACETWALCPNKPGMEEIVSLLITKDPESAAVDPELSALCAVHGNTRLLQQLASHGAPLNLPDKYGWTPLELARESRHHESEMYLQQIVWKGVLPSRWLLTKPSSALTTVSEDGLVITHPGHRRQCLSTDLPLPAGLDRYYFEITLRKPPSATEWSPNPKRPRDPNLVDGILEVAIGFCTSGAAAITFPGWPPKDDAPNVKSWGYYSDDGGVHGSEGSRSEPDPSRKYGFGVGDTVGCGVDLVNKVGWFTRNGCKYPFQVSGSQVRGRLFPLVGVHDPVVVVTNFSGPFRWTE